MNIRMIGKPLILGVVITATTLTGMSIYAWKQEQRKPVLEVYVFSLKSGRAVLIRTPDDKRMLVDGGGNSEIIKELTKILPYYSRRVDSVMATNTEGKNVTGLIDVIMRYKTETVYIPGITLKQLKIGTSTGEILDTLLETANERNIQVVKLAAEEEVVLGDSVSLEILFPSQPGKFAYSAASAPEILFKISYGSTSVVFIGKASNKVQKHLASSTPIGDAQVLVFSGNANSANISKQIMEKIHPEYIVHSASLNSKPSKNPPTPLVGIDSGHILNIKEFGTVKIVSDGNDVSVSGEISSGN